MCWTLNRSDRTGEAPGSARCASARGTESPRCYLAIMVTSDSHIPILNTWVNIYIIQMDNVQRQCHIQCTKVDTK